MSAKYLGYDCLDKYNACGNARLAWLQSFGLCDSEGVKINRVNLRGFVRVFAAIEKCDNMDILIWIYSRTRKNPILIEFLGWTSNKLESKILKSLKGK